MPLSDYLVPTLLKGDFAMDFRGKVSFINDLDLSEIKRVYMVENHEAGYVRAWHGHRKETKVAICIQGSCRLCAVSMESQDALGQPLVCKAYKFDIDSNKPGAVVIPVGFFNGFRNYTKDCKVLFFSNQTMADADDYRLPADKFHEAWDLDNMMR